MRLLHSVLGRGIALACVAAMLGACATSPVGRPRVVDANGVPLYKENNVSGRAAYNATGAGLVGIQKRFFDARSAIAAPNGETKANINQFLESGFALVHLGCNAYIEGKSDRQRSVNTARDLFVPLTALATGIIGLANDGDTDSDVLTALALATSATSAGFEVYEQRFLFGAENVDEVRSLILRAQATHANEALKSTTDNTSYEQAVLHLMHNQMLCSPGQILRLVNDAIDNGDVTAAAKIVSTTNEAFAPRTGNTNAVDDGQGQAGENAGAEQTTTEEQEFQVLEVDVDG